MFSFSSVSLVATLALAAFTSAASAPPVPSNSFAAVPSAAPSLPLAPRAAPSLPPTSPAPCDCAAPGVKALPAIIVDVTAKVSLSLDKLISLKKEECIVSVVKPIVLEVCDHLEVATKEVLALKSYSVKAILNTVDGTISLKGFCGLLAGLINLILSAVGHCLKCLTKLEGEVFDLLCHLGAAVANLLHCIFDILADVLVDMLAILCPLLSVNFWVIVKLRLDYLILILKIKA